MAKISYDSGATYSDDFSRPEYYDMNYRLPQLGLAGQIVQKMFPDPFSSGSYNNYMKQLVSNASVPAAPMQPYLAAARPVAEAAIAPIVAATPPASMMPANNFNLAQFNSAPNAQQLALAPPKMVQPETMAEGGRTKADDAAYEALMARLSEAYPSQPAYTPENVRPQSGQLTQEQLPLFFNMPRPLEPGMSNPMDFDPSGGVGQFGVMANAGPMSGMLDMSGQNGSTPGYNAMMTARLPEGLSASYRRSNEIGSPWDAENAISLSKALDKGSINATASRSGAHGAPSYDVSYSLPLTTGRNPDAPQFRLPSSREEQPMVPPSRRDRERQPSRKELVGQLYAGAGHRTGDRETHVRGGAKFNFADGGEVDAALHAVRHHLAGGGFLSDLFSGPDYLSTGEVASPTNWGDPEVASDFFKADKALRLAREVQASEPARDMPLPLRRPAPEVAPRQQIAAPAPAPAPAIRRIETLPGDTVEPHDFPPVLERTIGPYDFGQAVSGQQVTTQMLPHFRESPGFGQVLVDGKTNWADAQPEVPTSSPQKYTLPDAAFALPTPQAAINNAVSLAQNVAPQTEIPNAADALAAVEKLHNAGVYSGPELDRAGEILQAHNLAQRDNIPVDAALRLIRAEGPPMVNQGMPREERPAVRPLAYTATPAPAPAVDAIDQATGKLTARIPEEPHGTALTKQQADYVIRTIAAETSGKSPEETRAIASVILNRINSGKYGASPEAVLFAKRQFEPWMNPAGKNYPMNISPKSQRYSDARDALEAAMAGEDITGGATHFWGPKAQFALGREAPSWGRTGGVDIGETRFHKLERAEGGEVEGYAGGGDVVAKALAALRGGNKVFPKPQRMFPADARPPGGEYINAATGEAVTGQKPARAVLGVTPEGKPVFMTDPEQVDVTGSPGKGSTKTMTNLFRRSAGWDWKNAPEGYENVPMIVSTENRNKHYYSLGADYPKGVDLARYPKETSEPRLKPTTQGNVYPGEQVGTIVNKKTGDEHPVYDMITIRNMLAGTGAGAAGAATMPDDAAAEAPVDDALRVVREHHADGEAVGQAPFFTFEPRPLTIYRDNRPKAVEPPAETDADRVRAYKEMAAQVAQQSPEIQSMTHLGAKPTLPVTLDSGYAKGMELGRAPFDVAPGMSTLANTAYGAKTLPLYMNPITALPAAASDFTESAMDKSLPGMAMSLLGVPGKVAKYGAGALMGAAGMEPGEAQALFAGRLAKTADLGKLAIAERMAKAGADRSEIIGKTGWFQGSDGHWRFEIPDQKSFYRALPPVSSHAELMAQGPNTVGRQFVHDDLYKAYPNASDIKLREERSLSGPSEGSYGNGRIDLSGPNKSQTILHELQHYIQELEGFTPGSNPDFGWKRSQVEPMAKKLYERPAVPETDPDLVQLLKDFGYTEPDKSIPWNDLPMREKVQWFEPARSKLYHNTAGEVEARNVPRRMNMTPEELKATHPWETQDVPDVEHILNPPIGGSSKSIGAAQELANKAIQTYGTTHNIAEAGYVLPNGKMLDFSGRSQAGYNRVGDKFYAPQGKQDYLANDRAVDHRDVVHMMTGPEGMEGHEAMTKFMADASAIRNKPGIGFEVATIPTDKQIKTIVSSHNTKYRGEPMLVELSHPTTGDIVASRDFEKPNVEAIQKWFSEQAQANPDIKLAPKFSKGGKTSASVVDRALMLVSRQA